MSRNRAFLAVAVENYAIVVVTFVGTAIVSRMLSPREIGLFQLAMLFSTLVSTLRDFGLTEFVVQEKHLTEQRLRTAIGMNFVISYLFGGGLFLLSWPIATWFREDDVGKMIRIMCISFLFIPIGSVTIAYLKRNLEFVKIMKISIAAVILTQLSILLSVLVGCRLTP
jgi:O-antigen/teichoic acid export membrane protein